MSEESVRPRSATWDLHSDALEREPWVRPPLTGWSRRLAGRSASLWRLVPYVQPYRWRFIVMTVAGTLGVVVALTIPLVTRALIDGPVQAGTNVGVLAFGLGALALGGTEALLTFLRRITSSVASVGTESGIRLDLYAQLQRLPMSFHGRWKSGQLLSRMTSDMSTLRRFMSFGILFLYINVLQIAITIVLLIRLYWPLGLVTLAAVIPVIVTCLVMERHYTRLSRQIQDETGDVASSVEESVHGLRVIKAFGRRQWARDKFDARARQLYDTQLKRVRLIALFFMILDAIPNLALIAVLGIGAFAAARGDVSVGTLVAFLTLMISLVWPIIAMGFLLSMAQNAMTAADRVCEILDARNDITSGTVALPADRDQRGHLVFDDVRFRFADAETDTLDGINLDIAPGETVALVGGTGSGKTTLTSLVVRLQEVTGGRILLDGVDIRDLPLADLRGEVATAFEEPTLFSMSARENLTLGRPDATDTEITEAIEVAQAHFVYDLPWGLDTRIGEQGMSLSGGQRQRLALARAVLIKPAVLVLDDTLSALDIHTEAKVEAALAEVLGQATSIIVAHRASTVLLADRVAMLSQGRIMAIGQHAELLASVPAYRSLLSADFDAERESEHLRSGGRAVEDAR